MCLCINKVSEIQKTLYICLFIFNFTTGPLQWNGFGHIKVINIELMLAVDWRFILGDIHCTVDAKLNYTEILYTKVCKDQVYVHYGANVN